MIAEILPDAAIAVEARGDLMEAMLFPEEEAALGRAVDKRRREFTTGRACARRALAALGLPATPISSGANGEPQWPAGVVGSITHCDGYRACALGRAREFAAIGIDAEPNRSLPDGLLAEIARAEELSGLGLLARAAPAVRWDRLLFSAKESVYKVWFPLARRWLGFEDATLTFDLARRAFSARLLVSAPAAIAGAPPVLRGRWLVRDGFVLTAIALPAPGAEATVVSAAAPDTLEVRCIGNL